MSVTRNYARHLRVITVLQTITLQLRIYSVTLAALRVILTPCAQYGCGRERQGAVPARLVNLTFASGEAAFLT